MSGCVPDGFGAVTDNVDGALRMPRGDGVDDLTVGENVTVPMGMVRQISGRLGDTRPDDELQAGVVEVLEVASRQHAGVRGDDHLDTGDVVPGLEQPQHCSNESQSQEVYNYAKFMPIRSDLLLNRTNRS